MLARALRRVYGLIPYMILGLANQAWIGYTSGTTNHCVHIPIVHRIMDGSLYPNDPMIEAARAKYVSFYYHFLALLGGLFDGLEGPLFVTNVLFIGLFFAATAALSRTLFGDRAALLLGLALMWPQRFDLQLGGGFLQRDYNMQTFATAPLAIYAVTLHLRARPRLAFALLGLMFNFNGLGALYAVSLLGVASLVQLRTRGLSATLSDYAAFFVCALPAIVWQIQASSGEPLSEGWLAIMRARSASHSFPASWPNTDFYRYAIFFSLGLLSWSYVRAERAGTKLDVTFGWFGLVFLVSCLVGYLFSETWPVRAIILAQPFRTSSYITIFVLLYVADAARRLWGEPTWGHRLAAALLIISTLLPQYRDLLAVAAVAFVLAARDKLPAWATVPPIAVAGAFPLVKGQSIGAIGVAPLVGAIGSIFSKRLASIPLAALLGWHTLTRGMDRRLRLPLALCLFAAAYPLALASGFEQLFIPPAKRGAWEALQVWARRHTPKDALFLTPPESEGFRVHSRRSAFVEWKDGTIAYVDGRYGQLWWNRWSESPRGAAYDSIDEADLRAFTKKHRIDYVVMRRRRLWAFPAVYHNEKFWVYSTSPK